MPDLVHNRAKGRIVELAERINANDPANSAFLVIPFSSTDTDDVVRDVDDLAALEALSNTAEQTGSNWARKTLTDSDSITIDYDDANNRVDIDFPDQTWTAVAAGNDVTDIEIAYDSDTTGGTDANVVVGTWHDFPVTTDGSDVTMQLSADGFFRAQ